MNPIYCIIIQEIQKAIVCRKLQKYQPTTKENNRNKSPKSQNQTIKNELYVYIQYSIYANIKGSGFQKSK